MSAFTWNDDYTLAYAGTDDPRVVAVVQLDSDPSAPYGDALCPAYWLRARHYTWTADAAGDTFPDNDAADAYAAAKSRLDDDVAARYMRIFHDTRVLEIDKRGNGGSDLLVLLDTPAYRAHVGRDNSIHLTWTDADLFAGEYDEWVAYLDGEVYGVGYAVLPGRVTDETPIDNLDDWDVTIECWGFYGTEYAQEAALGFEHGAPALDTLLDV